MSDVILWFFWCMVFLGWLVFVCFRCWFFYWVILVFWWVVVLLLVLCVLCRVLVCFFYFWLVWVWLKCVFGWNDLFLFLVLEFGCRFFCLYFLCFLCLKVLFVGVFGLWLVVGDFLMVFRVWFLMNWLLRWCCCRIVDVLLDCVIWLWDWVFLLF